MKIIQATEGLFKRRNVAYASGMRSGGQSRARMTWGDPSAREWADWRWQLAHTVSDVRALGPLLGVGARQLGRLSAAAARYPFRATPYYLSLVEWGNPRDPIRRQCVPSPPELDNRFGRKDPFSEASHAPVPGLVRRYRDRALVMATTQCATYCRHCTRKNLLPCVGAGPAWEPIARYVAQHPEIREVILSGGDPLLLPPRALDRILARLRRIPHVEVIRVGTRLPAVLPMRVTDALCRVLANHRPLWVNTQFNHPREITPESAQACSRLVCSGVPVSNQAVLLRGVNDSLPVLRALCRGLQAISVRPYYLFQCDPVLGATHFAVPLRRGMAIAERLRTAVGGLCVPLYVLDLRGAAGKILLEPSRVASVTKRWLTIRGRNGRLVRHRNPCRA
ncbi:MAG: KamA family radical SAM protein [Kiritimatiellae bacterium]|nr:KamA family radical SAM protein [Kiritimatiellia bacterium]